MKKLLLLFITLFVTALNVNAQIIRTKDLEKYAKERYGERWNEAAANLASTLKLDKNNSLTYVQVINCPGKTKNQLYVTLNYWVTASFNDADSKIQLNDKELGCIIVQGFLPNIAEHMGGANAYDVSINPIIKLDIKEEKIRVTYTVQNYETMVYAGGGFLGPIDDTMPAQIAEKWAIERCYPFVKSDGHKKTSSKALIMTHAFSNVIMDKIEEAVKNGIVGNEDDNW